MQKVTLEIEKIQNMCNYVSLKQNDLAERSVMTAGRAKSDSRFSHTGTRPITQQGVN